MVGGLPASSRPIIRQCQRPCYAEEDERALEHEITMEREIEVEMDRALKKKMMMRVVSRGKGS